MKKRTLSLIGSALLLPGMFAAANAQAPDSEAYETASVCIWENKPQMQMTTPTYGVKIGVLGSFGAPVYGVEASVICAGSDEVNGFKGSLGYTLGKNVDGVMLAPVNFIEEANGLQIGAVNVAKTGKTVQFGLINFLEDGFLPVFPLVNFSL